MPKVQHVDVVKSGREIRVLVQRARWTAVGRRDAQPVHPHGVHRRGVHARIVVLSGASRFRGLGVAP